MKNNNSATWVEEFDPKFDPESERRIQTEIKGLRSEERADRVRHLPLRAAIWLAKVAAFALAVAAVFVTVSGVLSVTSEPQGSQSSIPRQR
jgi:hypothetical protein